MEDNETKKEPSLKELLENLNKNINEIKETKQSKRFNFRIPFMANVSKKQVQSGWITLLYINENKSISYVKAPIEEGVILINGVPHVPNPNAILTYKGKPFMIQPSWNTQPFEADKDYERAKADGTISRGWKLILNRYKSEAITAKKQWSSSAIVIGIIVLIVLGYLMTKGGKLF